MFDICVTLVNTKELSEIKHSLKTLLADTKDSFLNVAFVVVDNATGEDLDNLKNEIPNLEIVKQDKNYGFGYSHNVAFKKVSAKYYFILNPDTEFSLGQNFLQKLYDFMENNPKIGMVGPKIIYPDGSLQYSCYRFPSFWQPFFSRTKWGKTGKGKETSDSFLMKDFDHNQTIPVDWIMGSAMFARAEAMKETENFDNRYFMYAEDSDWCRKMWEKNWAVYYLHSVYLTHVHGRASAKVPGILKALVKNRYARVHLISWFKYFWKWRGNHKYYRI